MANPTRAELRTVVQAHARAGGVSYVDVDETVALDAATDRGLRDFAQYTYLIPVRGQAFDLVVGERHYNMGDCFFVTRLMIGGNVLLNHLRKEGPEDEGWFYENYPTWETDANNTPTLYLQEPENWIFIHPAPPAIGTNNFYSGYNEHFTMTADDGVDGTCQFGPSTLDLAAEWVATKLRNPHALGADIAGIIQAKSKEAGNQLMELRTRNRNMSAGSLRRRSQPRRLSFGSGYR